MTHSVFCKKSFFLHLSLDVGKINECDKLYKEFSFQSQIRGCQHPPAVQTLFEIAKGFLDNVSCTVQFQSLYGILDLVAEKHEVSIQLSGFSNSIFFYLNADATGWGLVDYEILIVLILVLGFLMTIEEFIAQMDQQSGLACFILSCFLGIVVKVQIHPAVAVDGISLVRPFLRIVPGNGLGRGVNMIVVIVVTKEPDVIAKL